MDTDSSDTEKMLPEDESTDPPAAVSNQNQEEAEGGHSDSDSDAGAGERAAGAGSGDGARDESDRSLPGAASEGSQATGHPENAG